MRILFFVLAMSACVEAPTLNKYCDGQSWLCGDPNEPVCYLPTNTCVPVGWICYDNDGQPAHYPDPTSQSDPNFSHCGPVEDAGPMPDMTVVDLTPPPDLLPPPDLTPQMHYNSDVQTDIDTIGCGRVGCHAVSTGTYAPLIQAMPGSVAMGQNYTNVMADVTYPNIDQSLFLTKPLATSGVSHAGSTNFKPFANTNDPTYIRWRIWIQEGARY